MLKSLVVVAVLVLGLVAGSPVLAIDSGLVGSRVDQVKLEQLLSTQEVKTTWPANFLKVAVRKAVEGGVPANTVVLLLLFPLVAVLVAFSRNVVGVNGFGIFTPAVLSVAFLSTGIVTGLLLFGVILVTATISRLLIRRVKLPYLPRMAFLIWLVSLSVLGLLVLAPTLRVLALGDLGIFPILLFVLLAETFIDAQITRTVEAAVIMTVETLVLALLAFYIISSFLVQALVLLHPEVTALTILIFDLLIGKYTGLRLLEVWRFRDLLNKK
jgi:hypothetical protein